MWYVIWAGCDFFAWDQPIDRTVTNPPWSQVWRLLYHDMGLSDHVVFLLTNNHMWTEARLREIRTARFGLRKILLVDMPWALP
jgi:hypothetical protein